MSETTKFIGIVFAGIILLIFVSIIGVGLGIITLPWHSVEKQVETGHDVVDKTYTADNAIYNYEWFKTQYNDIKATENKINNTQDQMNTYFTTYGYDTSKWDYNTKTTYNQLQTTFLGQKSYYEDLVSEYNARSEMANRNIFKDQLPMHVDSILEKTQL
ncbi:MAG: hypothetical protein ABFD07_00495 [Methanobacterium sp.]